ncbi:hypothetical protein FW778_20720 [Ginsengibacter hankyongi]|uniref:Aminoglycoside phosphotransferase domain-containing protein n=1 Tax=Ginsengibacter hankyongi TaxID=2607284 RepID=A0A5J5IEI4_9BACT|nr:hypothetical protein [Ginsengibacter hankyongi]KAA9035650.1 hypothetical protein FW778_20720 [Ginsengibacter hankyongi]
MTKEQINRLVSDGIFPDVSGNRELIETHISWVIKCNKFVYKIKKPVHYSFLDFSTVELRRHFCEREIELNRRLAKKVYLDVLPIHEWKSKFIVGGKGGKIIDNTVRMLKLDANKQMDHLLKKNQVTKSHIKKLAKTIAGFHKRTEIIYEKDFMKIKQDFSDLKVDKTFLVNQLGSEYNNMINDAVEKSDSFIEQNKELLAARLRDGLYRDCHGDLHSRNIFLLPAPLPFDCIEFNDDFRQIDVVNEIAFLCMDLDAFGREDLSALFIDYYNRFFPAIKTNKDHTLFIYYKSYRANVRAKVNGLRAKSAANKEDRTKALSEAEKYLRLMNDYLRSVG